MKHLPVLYISSLFLLATQMSCNKQLNVLPTTKQVDGNVIFDLKSAKTALNGVYYQFAAVGTDMNGSASLNWSYVNELVPSQLSGMFAASIYNNPILSEHNYTPATAEISQNWEYDYKIVNAANGFIKNVTPVSSVKPADKRTMIAEARFLRAFANAGILFYYGEWDNINSANGIVLRKDVVSTSNINLPRSTVKESYDFILEDLDSAINGLPVTIDDNVYVNSWAARLLKARVLIQRGGTADYPQVVSICNDIISNGPFTLEENTKDIFLSAALTSNEVMLGVKPFPNETGKFYNYMWLSVSASDLMQQWFSEDPRKDWMTKTVDVFGDIGEAVTKYYPGPSPIAEFTSISENCYALRLTEAYLLQAEAITASAGSLNDARSLLKTVLSHAGVTDFSEVDAINNAGELRKMIIQETMKNFAGEAGQDWFAVRRLPFTDLQQLLPSVMDKHQLIFPIPLPEMTRNPALQGKQNPGYGN